AAVRRTRGTRASDRRGAAASPSPAMVRGRCLRWGRHGALHPVTPPTWSDSGVRLDERRVRRHSGVDARVVRPRTTATPAHDPDELAIGDKRPTAVAVAGVVDVAVSVARGARRVR